MCAEKRVRWESCRPQAIMGALARHQALSTLTSDFQPPEKKPLLLLYHIQRVLCYSSPSRCPRTFYREVQLRQTALLP